MTRKRLVEEHSDLSTGESDTKYVETNTEQSLSNTFPNIEDNPNVVDVEDEEKEALEELVRILEDKARLYPYIDEYKIVVIPESQEPMIVINEAEFEKLQEKVLGQRKIR